jgi:hypothetical protein
MTKRDPKKKNNESTVTKKTQASLNKKSTVNLKTSRPTIKTASRKKTILHNPLAQSKGSWSSLSQSNIFRQDISNSETVSMRGNAQNLNKMTSPRSGQAPKNDSGAERLELLINFERGSVDYYFNGHWKNVEIILINNELGVFDDLMRFYPLRTFQTKKSSESISSFTKWWAPSLLMGGVPGLIFAGFLCIGKPSITGYLYSASKDTIKVKLGAEAIVFLELAVGSV